MSYSITIPSGPVSEFTERANAAVAAYAKQLEVNDYKLDDIAQGQLDPSIAAAADLATKLYGDSDVDVAGTLVGHVNEGNAAGTTCTIYIGTVVKAVAEAAPTIAPTV